MANDTAANVLATIGTVCWCVQLVPQIIHNFRHKSTEGLPGAMMFIWALSALPFGVYFLLLDESVPLEVQPQLFGSLSIITWCQVLYYSHNFSLKKVLICGTGLAAVLGGLEALFVLVIRHPQNDHGITWPRLLFGVLATVLFAVGFIPTFLELYRSQGRVIGIDFIFLSIDMSGALFSLISLAFEGSFDVLGAVLYIVILVCELAIIASHCIWCLCHWGIVKEARSRKMTVDAVMAEREEAAREDTGDEATTATAATAAENEQPPSPRRKTQDSITTTEVQDDDTILGVDLEEEEEATAGKAKDLEKGIKDE